jgi:hypothetical protein
LDQGDSELVWHFFSEGSPELSPPCFVILSEAKDLLYCQRMRQQVLRFAQDDNFNENRAGNNPA